MSDSTVLFSFTISWWFIFGTAALVLATYAGCCLHIWWRQGPQREEMRRNQREALNIFRVDREGVVYKPERKIVLKARSPE